MKIAIVGETRLPVLPYGPGGLGRATHDIATQLASRGHSVTLYAGAGSDFDAGDLQPLPIFRPRGYDVLLDYSHAHLFGGVFGDMPTLNLIGDRECEYIPTCAVVETEYMRRKYTSARVIPAGIDVDAIPFCPANDGDYLVFMGLNIGHKQPHVAADVARRADMRLWSIGSGEQVVSEVAKWEIVGHARGLLAPYTIDASPRTPLEAAACGTPTLCLDGDGTREHVADGLTGFVCHGVSDMVAHVPDLAALNRENIRIWAKQNHDIQATIVNIENLLAAVAGGEKW